MGQPIDEEKPLSDPGNSQPEDFTADLSPEELAEVDRRLAEEFGEA